MYGTILTFTKFNNFGTQRLNGPRHLFHSFCCTTRRIFEPLHRVHVYEPGFNTDKYGTLPPHLKGSCGLEYNRNIYICKLTALENNYGKYPDVSTLY